MKKLAIIVILVLTLFASINLANHETGMSGGIINFHAIVDIINFYLRDGQSLLQINRSNNVAFAGEQFFFNISVVDPNGAIDIGDVFVHVNGSIQANCVRTSSFTSNLSMTLGNFSIVRYYYVNGSNGTYNNTFYNNLSVVLNSSFNNGTFTSFVFDTNGTAQFINISWVEGLPYGEELPNYQQIENVMNGSNMSGNVLLMHMNEIAYDSVPVSNDVEDFSGYNNHGNESGGITFNAEGKFNRSFRFDGFDDFIDMGDKASLESSGDFFTVEAWIMTNGSPTSDMIVAKKDDASPGYYLFIDALGQLNGRFDNSIFAADATSASLVNDNMWHHIVMVRSTNTITIYIDGVQDGTNTAGGAIGDISNSVNARIGRSDHSAGPYNFNGTIDEVAIYNRSLSAQEIFTHYLRGALQLNLTVRSCDDPNCIGDPWNSTFTKSPANLSIPINRYFQFMANFFSYDAAYSPELYNTTIFYNVTLNITLNNNVTGYYYTCIYTVEPNNASNITYGNMTIAPCVIDLSGGLSCANNQTYFFNPMVRINISNGPVQFPLGLSGQTVQYGPLIITNLADDNLILNISMNARDLYDPRSNRTLCPTSNVLRIENIRYSVTNGSNTAGNFSLVRPLAKQVVMPNEFIAPGESLNVTFYLTYPTPCIGIFNASRSLQFFADVVNI